MKIYHSIKKFNVKNPILTVGTFDGVHLGHKKIINTLVENAKKLNGEAVVFTLYPHPRKVLFPDTNDLFFLNTINDKAKLLENAGVKHLIIYPFTKDFATLSACAFIEKILFRQLKIKQLIVGYDHRIGKDMQGNLLQLQKCSKQYDIEVIKVDALIKKEVTISSTKIRNELVAGNIELANLYLSYEYNISGKIVSGNRIGRKLGFPTANIKVDTDKLIPAKGVYAVKVIINDVEYKGMLNIGIRPTVDTSNQNVIEVHIFNFEQNIYDKIIEIKFVKFIRNEMKFSNIENLKKQLIIDKKNIELLFL